MCHGVVFWRKTLCWHDHAGQDGDSPMLWDAGRTRFLVLVMNTTPLSLVTASSRHDDFRIGPPSTVDAVHF